MIPNQKYYYLKIKKKTYEIIPCIFLKNLPNLESQISYETYISESKWQIQKVDEYEWDISHKKIWEKIPLSIIDNKNPKFEKVNERVKTDRLFETAEQAKLGILDYLIKQNLLIETESYIDKYESNKEKTINQFISNQKFTFNLNSVINFGKKHKGALIKDVIKEDYQYYTWLISVGYKMSEEVKEFARKETRPSYEYEGGGWANVDPWEADAWGGCCPNM